MRAQQPTPASAVRAAAPRLYRVCSCCSQQTLQTSAGMCVEAGANSVARATKSGEFRVMPKSKQAHRRRMLTCVGALRVTHRFPKSLVFVWAANAPSAALTVGPDLSKARKHGRAQRPPRAQRGLR